MMQPSETTPLSTRRRKSDQRRRLVGWRKELWDWTKALVVAFAVVLLLRAYVFQLSTVKMHSMQPTLQEKEWLFVNKIVYSFGHPGRGDVVILKDPSGGPDRKDYLVKRIVGMPGDRLEIRRGQLYLNGQLTVEPYTDSVIEDGDFGPTQVSAGHYFVMGDNRHLGGSKDSRAFKEVPEDMIIGKAEFIVWPIVRWAKL
ncbi:signal peptidase I [Cohnella sp. CFH 77786]|uniref:signal peptidase I n=1 Tax=Cohnella sp. CFH 77786 TaxID=2662265 RepID=UPI001C60C14E|nr:signal peptidase I [Cohnella sp. CFH 77786]MBW5445619.1 signal peptidase I [Cohnella sp. CFH 77786]